MECQCAKQRLRSTFTYPLHRATWSSNTCLSIQPGFDTSCRTVHVHFVSRLSVTSRPCFADLHRAFAASTGIGVLVNTSFNGFHEPIVCSPRDAVRVFYGTGLDVLVLGRFIVRK